MMVMMNSKKSIAVIIPCYNEEKTIGKVVSDFNNALPKATIYVYDNNSTDRTIEFANKAGAIVRSEYRQGKGIVSRTMFRNIDADCFLMVDGDGTYSATTAKKMCEMVLCGDADMVIGDRLSANYLKENKRILHGFGNRLVRFLINSLFGSSIKDILSGYRAMSRKFVKTCPILSKGFEVETEITIHALDKGFSVKEIPVKYKNRVKGSYSKLKTVGDGRKVILTIVRLFAEHSPMKFFGFLSVISIVFSLVLGIPVLVEYFETGLVPKFPSLIAAGFFLLIGVVMLVCGIILQVVVKKHRELFEVLVSKD